MNISLYKINDQIVALTEKTYTELVAKIAHIIIVELIELEDNLDNEVDKKKLTRLGGIAQEAQREVVTQYSKLTNISLSGINFTITRHNRLFSYVARDGYNADVRTNKYRYSTARNKTNLELLEDAGIKIIKLQDVNFPTIPNTNATTRVASLSVFTSNAAKPFTVEGDLNYLKDERCKLVSCLLAHIDKKLCEPLEPKGKGDYTKKELLTFLNNNDLVFNYTVGAHVFSVNPVDLLDVKGLIEDYKVISSSSKLVDTTGLTNLHQALKEELKTRLMHKIHVTVTERVTFKSDEEVRQELIRSFPE